MKHTALTLAITGLLPVLSCTLAEPQRLYMRELTALAELQHEAASVLVFDDAAGSNAAGNIAAGSIAENYIVSKPVNGAVVITGVSGRMLHPQEELRNALDDAAKKAAWFHGVYGRFTTEIYTAAAGFHDFYLNTAREIYALEGDYEKYKAALTFNGEQDITRIHDTVFIRFTFSAPDMQSLDYESGMVNGVPSWVKSGARPDIPGYGTAVGFAGRHRYTRQAIEKSCESALAALIAGVSSGMETRDGGSSLYGASSTITEVLEGVLSRFLILELWIDPKTGGVWTLAAAQTNQQIKRQESALE